MGNLREQRVRKNTSLEKRNPNKPKKNWENRNGKFGRNKKEIYLSGGFVAIVALTISDLQSGKINEAIGLAVGAFLVFPILYYLANLIWDE